MIEAKTHYARGIDVEFGVSETGKEAVAVRFKIEGGIDDGEEITWFGYFTDKTAQRTLEALRYCGWTSADLGELSAEVVGRNLVQIVVEHDEYKGKVRAKVAWVNRPGGPLLKNAMDDSKRREFAARMRSLAARIDPKLAAPTDAVAPPAQRKPAPQNGRMDGWEEGAPGPGYGPPGPGFAEDDIPF